MGFIRLCGPRRPARLLGCSLSLTCIQLPNLLGRKSVNSTTNNGGTGCLHRYIQSRSLVRFVGFSSLVSLSVTFLDAPIVLVGFRWHWLPPSSTLYLAYRMRLRRRCHCIVFGVVTYCRCRRRPSSWMLPLNLMSLAPCCCFRHQRRCCRHHLWRRGILCLKAILSDIGPASKLAWSGCLSLPRSDLLQILLGMVAFTNQKWAG